MLLKGLKFSLMHEVRNDTVRIRGSYDPQKNIISVCDPADIEAVCHELFHCLERSYGITGMRYDRETAARAFTKRVLLGA